MNWKKLKLILLAFCFMLFAFLTVLKTKRSIDHSIKAAQFEKGKVKKKLISEKEYIVKFKDNIDKIKNFDYPDKWIEKPEIFQKDLK